MALTDWSVGLTGVSDLFNSASSVGNWIFNMVNYKDMKAREDSAVQRRAADLAAAGLSKTLAAGSAAGSSYASSSSAQFSNQLAGALLDKQRLDDETKKVDATVANIDADTQNKKDENAILKKQSAILSNQLLQSDIDTRIASATARNRLSTSLNLSGIEAMNALIEKNIADFANNNFADYHKQHTRDLYYARGAGYSQNKLDKQVVALGSWLQDVTGLSNIVRYFGK